jgi:carbonic anhydrase
LINEKYFLEDNQLYSKLLHNQSPDTILIGCCDSRVDPAIITDCDPGDIFVVRNVANLVAPYGPDHRCHGTSSALEYAVKVLNVKNIIILGHSNCGGIAALIDNSIEMFEFLGPWMETPKAALQKILKVHSDYTSEECKVACGIISLT